MIISRLDFVGLNCFGTETLGLKYGGGYSHAVHWPLSTEKTMKRLGIWQAIPALLVCAFALSGSSTALAQTPAAVPLFRDPIHDGAADPVVVWNRARHTWWMLYTNRRADLNDNNGVTWVHGTHIGIAESSDGGAHWKYVSEAAIPLPQARLHSLGARAGGGLDPRFLSSTVSAASRWAGASRRQPSAPSTPWRAPLAASRAYSGRWREPSQNERSDCSLPLGDRL